MTPAGPLPQSFPPWLTLSSDAEVLTLLDLVKAALVKRRYVVAVAAEKIPIPAS